MLHAASWPEALGDTRGERSRLFAILDSVSFIPCEKSSSELTEVCEDATVVRCAGNHYRLACQKFICPGSQSLLRGACNQLDYRLSQTFWHFFRECRGEDLDPSGIQGAVKGQSIACKLTTYSLHSHIRHIFEHVLMAISLRSASP